ncbi:hypothetical protein CP967_11805 [Streptomyces nitrosporeus]|uniref:Uncharacterized protein n=1 Tax=Streptomyces nitrosporeus TaxID=28894 RepID=A0A5J6F8C8_9ACTN|nr:hypothetical protein [Streptomyces nitrosporeus]QEU72588.1 hypothetical protein CP967_11805 [Streptomyces nitrosporeus]GGY76720.1 hypothetical protein GCM10010327_03430 [Streptomyces nitrosporeus]
MTDPYLTAGNVWQLRHGPQEIARLAVTGTDMPWVRAEVETLPGFERFRPVFADQEQALEEEDWDRADACYDQIRTALTLTFPDGGRVAEFMLRIHGDGTAGWRWHHEPFVPFGTAGP